MRYFGIFNNASAVEAAVEAGLLARDHIVLLMNNQNKPIGVQCKLNRETPAPINYQNTPDMIGFQFAPYQSGDSVYFAFMGQGDNISMARYVAYYQSDYDAAILEGNTPSQFYETIGYSQVPFRMNLNSYTPELGMFIIKVWAVDEYGQFINQIEDPATGYYSQASVNIVEEGGQDDPEPPQDMPYLNVNCSPHGLTPNFDINFMEQPTQQYPEFKYIIYGASVGQSISGMTASQAFAWLNDNYTEGMAVRYGVSIGGNTYGSVQGSMNETITCKAWVVDANGDFVDESENPNNNLFFSQGSITIASESYVQMSQQPTYSNGYVTFSADCFGGDNIQYVVYSMNDYGANVWSGQMTEDQYITSIGGWTRVEDTYVNGLSVPVTLLNEWDMAVIRVRAWDPVTELDDFGAGECQSMVNGNQPQY